MRKYSISPHVNIYKFPITAISSITNRITGVYLSGLFIVGGLSCLTNKTDYIKSNYNNLSNIKKTIFNYSIFFPTIYHTYGGIRHIIWDKYPKFLNNSSVAKSSYLLFTTSIISTIIAEKIFKK
jgi:succinate dehydrogenase (ubiquinone) cytochrome b560 subunit